MKIEPDGWIDRDVYRKQIIIEGAGLGEGNLVQLVEVLPRKTVGMHHHKVQTEFFHILAGEATLVMNGKSFRAKPGDSYLCAPGTMHSVINDTDKKFKLIVFKTNHKKGDSYWE